MIISVDLGEGEMRLDGTGCNCEHWFIAGVCTIELQYKVGFRTGQGIL